MNPTALIQQINDLQSKNEQLTIELFRMLELLRGMDAVLDGLILEVLELRAEKGKSCE